MTRVSPAPPERFAEVADHMERWQRTKGYPPNSWFTLLRKPRVFRAYRDLHTAVMMEDGITEIVAVIALLGWLTRWNVTLATRLEPAAAAFARAHLARSGWVAGAHGETADTAPGAP